MVWRCAHRADEVLLAWPDEQQLVFFDPATGNTHLLGALAGLLAECLGAQALDLATLMTRVHGSLELSEGMDLEATLREHLQRLSAIGLLQESDA